MCYKLINKKSNTELNKYLQTLTNEYLIDYKSIKIVLRLLDC